MFFQRLELLFLQAAAALAAVHPSWDGLEDGYRVYRRGVRSSGQILGVCCAVVDGFACEGIGAIRGFCV